MTIHNCVSWSSSVHSSCNLHATTFENVRAPRQASKLRYINFVVRHCYYAHHTTSVTKDNREEWMSIDRCISETRRFTTSLVFREQQTTHTDYWRSTLQSSSEQSWKIKLKKKNHLQYCLCLWQFVHHQDRYHISTTVLKHFKDRNSKICDKEILCRDQRRHQIW